MPPTDEAPAKQARRWTRYHSDDWTGLVVKTDAGEFRYNAWQGAPTADMHTSESLVNAQHQAEDIVRNSGHRCTARCSFWVPDTLGE